VEVELDGRWSGPWDLCSGCWWLGSNLLVAVMDQVIAAADELRDLIISARCQYGMDTPLPPEVLMEIMQAKDRHQRLWDAHFMTAYEHGQRAWSVGHSTLDNPYDRVEERTKHDDWMDGFMEAWNTGRVDI
jgi:hypothetical protein